MITNEENIDSKAKKCDATNGRVNFLHQRCQCHVICSMHPPNASCRLFIFKLFELYIELIEFYCQSIRNVNDKKVAISPSKDNDVARDLCQKSSKRCVAEGGKQCGVAVDVESFCHKCFSTLLRTGKVDKCLKGVFNCKDKKESV